MNTSNGRYHFHWLFIISTLCIKESATTVGLADLRAELQLGESQVRERAKKARTFILHDYSRFSVLTIDRFFQRIIRAFIKELGIDLNYNIELDTNTLLKRSADGLVESIAENHDLRRWLLEFAEERIAEGDRWDMRGDLSALGRELFKEKTRERMEMKHSKESFQYLVAKQRFPKQRFRNCKYNESLHTEIDNR